MDSLLELFINIGKLKDDKRKGWTIFDISNPDTTADHLFRSALLGWVLNKEKGLDEGILLKMILIHHLPELIIGQETPYDALLPKDLTSPKEKKKFKELVQELKNIPLTEEKLRAKKRFDMEKLAMDKLVKRLPTDIKKEITSIWKKYITQSTKEGKFAWQIGKLETLIQATEYHLAKENFNYELWFKWSKRKLKDPLILDFVKAIELKVNKSKKRNKMSAYLDFMIEIGKLKRLYRTGWVLRGVKDPENVSQHTYQLAMMSWLFGWMRGVDTIRAIKIALAHDLCEVYAGDQTPYDPILMIRKNEVKEIFNKPPRVELDKRLPWLIEKKTKEWKAMITLTAGLDKKDQEEFVNLWIDLEEGLTKEGRFVHQLDKMVNLFQAIEYWKKDKTFPIIPWWIDLKEVIDDSDLLRFMDELNKEYSIIDKRRKK